MTAAPRTPSARFDDIPGKLPEGTVPTDLNLTDVAHDAIAKLNDLSPNSLTETAIWRDLLALTGTYRTFYSQQNVIATLKKLSEQKRCSPFSLKEVEPRLAKSLDDVGWLDVDVAFRTESEGLVAQCAGTVSVVQSKADGQWRIWMLRTWLECFDGHGHPDVLEPSPRQAETNGGLTNGHSNGVHDDEPASDYDAVVIGGGQAGLAVAGRLKALDVKYIVLDRHPQIGDVWATRYESLRWHTTKEYGSLPFGHTYPADYDYLLPAKLIGAGHKAWAEKYGINVRTSTSVDSAVYDQTSNTWTIQTSSPDHGHHTLRASNLVLAIGTGHLTPLRPTWASPENLASSRFKGTILHSTTYQTSAPWAGKHGIVIGTANTGHDVAQDMADAGLETTMVQRSPTHVFPMEWLHAAEDAHYRSDKDPAEADRETFTYPNKIMREMVNRAAWRAGRAEAERFDALERVGFRVQRYGDIYNNIYVRFGGHYIDTGVSARIAKGEIRVEGGAVAGLTEKGVRLECGREVQADLIVLCTGFDHDFRKDAAAIVGAEAAGRMDEFYGVDGEGEVRGHARLAGHPGLYYHGGDVRMARFFSRFIALQIQADVLGKPLQRYTQ